MASEADETLQEYDENNDGFIHYGEFYRNHKKMLDAQQRWNTMPIIISYIFNFSAEENLARSLEALEISQDIFVVLC